jgi:dipeptidyl aminopeptidase/acylaminoacyl peptidase
MIFSTCRAHLTLPAVCLLLLLPTTLPAQKPAALPTLTPSSDTANPNAEPTRLAQPGGVALSPDGAFVAWTLRNGQNTSLHLSTVANPDPAKEQLITVGSATECSNESPFWSPDSQTLAFLSTCTGEKSKPQQQQVFLWSRSTATAKQLTHLTGKLEQPTFSPDGKSIAFLFVENATRSAGALDAMKPWAGVIGEDGVEIQRVAAINVANGDFGWLTPKDLHVYEFTWAPDSYHIAFIAAPPPGENNWWVAKLYVEFASPPCEQHEHTICVTTATPPIQTGPLVPVLDPTTIPGPLHGLQIAVPRYSPDGTQIAFIGGLMSDQGSTGGDVWVVPSKGGEPADITPGIDGTASFFVWLRDNRIGLAEDRRGHILLPDYDVAKRAYIDGSVLDLGEISVSGGQIKDDISISKPFKSFAFVQSSYNLAPEVWVFSATSTGIAPKQITHLNDTFPKPTTRTESIEWTSDSFNVQGWLTYPTHYDPKKKYPMIVQVHGGPSASAGPPRTTPFASLGYFEFTPNPRGSFGQGEAFTQANRKDFGYGDLRDILAGIDAIEKKVSIDDHRLGITGWSYGGFMTMFAVTQTHRFRAAVAGAGISDWLSYYGENSIDQWMVPFFGAPVYDDPAVYAKSSAINFIKNATTPTLVIVGDRDGECPAPQSFEFWHALRAQNVKTQLVVYPNEGHGFRNPAHIKDRADRVAKWFADNMPEGKE